MSIIMKSYLDLSLANPKTIMKNKEESDNLQNITAEFASSVYYTLKENITKPRFLFCWYFRKDSLSFKNPYFQFCSEHTYCQ